MTAAVALLYLLVLAVLFVNGWTDAPNAIALRRGLRRHGLPEGRRPGRGVQLSPAPPWPACSSPPWPPPWAAWSPFPTPQPPSPPWARPCCPWCSGRCWPGGSACPPSESHALLSGLSGAALALGPHRAALQAGPWLWTLAGLALSLPAGALAARLFRRWLTGRTRSAAAWQRRAAAAMALLHGAQDSQKFLALLLLAGGLGGLHFAPSLPLLLLISGTMAAGTALGGRPHRGKGGHPAGRPHPRGRPGGRRRRRPGAGGVLPAGPARLHHPHQGGRRPGGRAGTPPPLPPWRSPWPGCSPFPAVPAWPSSSPGCCPWDSPSRAICPRL